MKRGEAGTEGQGEGGKDGVLQSNCLAGWVCFYAWLGREELISL